MIDNSKVSNIPCRLHNVGEGGVAGADEVIDDNKGKSQQQINAEVDQILGAGGSVDERIAVAVNAEKTRAEGAEEDLDGRVDTLEEAVGTGGSVDSRIASAVSPKANSADVYTKSETYTKEEVHNLVTTPNQEYVSVTATDQTTSVTDVLPATGAADTTYRVGNWDGNQYNDSVFSEYAWNGSAYIKLSTKSQVGEVYDISANHAGTKYADLAAALGTNGANIPQSLRKGGMSVKFVQSSDNKYVQYFLTKNVWSTLITDWYKINVTDELDKIYRDLNSAVTLTPDSIPIPFTSTMCYGDIYSPLLKKGNKIKILVTSCVNNGVAQTTIGCFGAPPKWVPLGTITVNTEKVITLTQDFDFIRCGSGEVHDSFVGTYKIISNVADEVSKLVPDVQQLKENVDEINSSITEIENTFSFTNTSATDLYSPYIKAGYTIEILINQATIDGSTPSVIIVNGQRPNTNWVVIGRARVGSKLKIELNEDFNVIRLGNGETYEVSNGTFSLHKTNSLIDTAEERGTQLDEVDATLKDAIGVLGRSEPVTGTFDFQNTHESDIYSPYFKKGNKVRILVTEVKDAEGTAKIYIACFGAPPKWVPLGTITVNTEKVITLTQDLDFIRIGSGEVNQKVTGTYVIETDVSQKVNSMIPISDSFRFENTEASDLYSPYLRTGSIFSVLVDEAVDDGSQTYNQALFGRPINDVGWISLGSVIVGSETTITLAQDFLYIRVGGGQTHDLVRGSYNIFTKECVDVSRKIEKIVDQGGIDYRSKTQYRVLVLGDSFSQGGGSWTQPMVELLGTNSSIISLGVSSATVHVRNNDTVNYPFTDRPVSSDNSGNHNAMYSQVLKLKRLMAGIDLDEGETAIYQTPEEYPNVIIIAGGMNDWYDTDEIVELYTSYLNKTVTNVYTKRTTSETEVELGSTIIKTPLEETNKRSFLVSYRMMIEELHDIFPNAQIFITTVCPTAWAPTGQVRDMAADHYKIASQQRYCADLLGVSVIDWYRDGQISYLWNNVQGSGTQEDPYIWGQNLLPYADNGDLLHPNIRGGKKYGRLAACVIKNNFLKIE